MSRPICRTTLAAGSFLFICVSACSSFGTGSPYKTLSVENINQLALITKIPDCPYALSDRIAFSWCPSQIIGYSMTEPGTGLFKIDELPVYYSPHLSPDMKRLILFFSDYLDLRSLPDGSRVATIAEKYPALAFSPDGKTFATTGSDDNILVRLWDSATGNLLKSLPPSTGEEARGYSIAIHPQEKWLAVGGKGKVYLWDMNSEHPSVELPVTQSMLQSDDEIDYVSFSPDGWRLVVSSTGGTQVWDLETMTELPFLRSADTRGRVDIFFSPDGSLLVAIGNKGPRIWNVDGGMERIFENISDVYALPDTEGGAFGFNPSGTRLLAIDNDRVYVWDVSSGKSLFSDDLSSEACGSVEAHSPDWRLIACESHDGKVVLWDVFGRKPAYTLPDDYTVQFFNGSINFSPDGKLLSAVFSGLSIPSPSQVYIYGVK